MEHQTKESATSRRASREATPRTGAHPEFGTRRVRTVGRGNSDSHTPQVIRSVRLCSYSLCISWAEALSTCHRDLVLSWLEIENAVLGHQLTVICRWVKRPERAGSG